MTFTLFENTRIKERLPPAYLAYLGGLTVPSQGPHKVVKVPIKQTQCGTYKCLPSKCRPVRYLQMSLSAVPTNVAQYSSVPTNVSRGAHQCKLYTEKRNYIPDLHSPGEPWKRKSVSVDYPTLTKPISVQTPVSFVSFGVIKRMKLQTLISNPSRFTSPTDSLLIYQIEVIF